MNKMCIIKLPVFLWLFLFSVCGCGYNSSPQRKQPAIAAADLRKVVEGAINASVTLNGNGGQDIYFGIIKSIEKGFSDEDVSRVLESIKSSFRDRDELATSGIQNGLIICPRSNLNSNVGRFGVSVVADNEGAIVVTFCLY